MAPIVAVANLWVLGPSFRGEGRRLVAGLALPAVAAVLEYVWLLLYGRRGYNVLVVTTVVVLALFLGPIVRTMAFPLKRVPPG
jgi:hypothetical protein